MSLSDAKIRSARSGDKPRNLLDGRGLYHLVMVRVTVRAIIMASFVIIGFASTSTEAWAKTCSGATRLTGTIKTKSSTIKFVNESVDLAARHCIDVDRQDQGGCVSVFQVTTQRKRGCRLTMTLVRHPVDDVFEIRSMGFVTDSYCRGWLDPTEGNYIADELDHNVRAPKQVARGQETLDTACFPAKISVRGKGEFRQQRAMRLTGAEFGLKISGIARSTGSVTQRCLKVQKPSKPVKTIAKKRKARKRRAQPKPKKMRPISRPVELPLMRFGVGLGDSSTERLVFSGMISFGGPSAVTFEAVSETFIGLGLSYIVGAGKRFELQPRLTIGFSRDDLSFGMGITSRFLIWDTFGLNWDAAWLPVVRMAYQSLGLSLRF